jgi:V/A-type H+/Na+-transporting ATPase subunit D
MAFGPRIPPGRAGRMWLRRRAETATRGRDQLDRRLRILVPEQQRLRLQADRSRAAWTAACEGARTWLLRATLLGGEDAVRMATPSRPAEFEIGWTAAMGLSYPGEVRVVDPAPLSPAPAGNAAVAPAVEAFRTALLAAVRAAAAEEALRRVEEEIAVTRRRVRALDKRWLPWLAESLAALDLSLEQAEQEDGMRLRRAAGPRPDRRTPS